MNEACENCRFWAANQLGVGHSMGFCHRFPPHGSPDQFPDPFAVTRAEDWCGEFEQIEDEAKLDETLDDDRHEPDDDAL